MQVRLEQLRIPRPYSTFGRMDQNLVDCKESMGQRLGRERIYLRIKPVNGGLRYRRGSAHFGLRTLAGDKTKYFVSTLSGITCESLKLYQIRRL